MSDSASPSTVLVVSFDRWPWPALGCYGHEWIDTPSWDQFAAEGFLFDRCVATINKDARAHETLWNNFRLGMASTPATLLHESGASPLGNDLHWNQVREIVGNDAADAPLGERSFARLVQAAIGELQSKSPADSPRLVWVHGVGLPERCPVSRAALELYAADFAEEGLQLAAMTDEELVDHELTRATALSLLDHWLGELLDAARSLPGRKWMTVFAWEGAIWEPAPRPTPLIAPFDPQQAQVPWIVAGDDIDPGRTLALVTTGDVLPTIAGWLQHPVQESASEKNLASLIAGDVNTVHPDVMVQQEDRGGLWTADDLTLLARSGDADGDVQRYLWPEDGYAINNIAAQTPDIAAERLAAFYHSSGASPSR